MKNPTLAAILLISLLFTGKAQAAEFCADSYHINRTFNNNASWDMCWAYDANEGIRLHSIFYTPAGDERRMVLNEASIAQIHVPYDDNGARYHDVSDFGLGGDNLLSISASECANGQLGRMNSRPVVCQSVKQVDAAWRTHTDAATQYYLSVSSASRVGEYIYTADWKFYSDGRIEPTMLATGALQRYAGTSSEAHGWVMPNNSQQPGRRIGLAHMHNFFWRLDFDLDGTPVNDRIEEVNVYTDQGKRITDVSVFGTEAARSLDPQRMRSWLIRDGAKNNDNGHAIGYEIRLPESGQREVGPDFEPFTRNDFYVTRARTCERIASHNQRVNPCDADDLSEFVNGESISGQDTVSWVGLSFYHMPRAEDAPYMDAHASAFEITPRDWHAKNPLSESTTVSSRVLRASDDYVTASSGGSLLINAMSNDTGENIRIESVQDPENGSVRLVNNQIEYQPNPGYIGTDIFWYNIVDGQNEKYGAQIHATVITGTSGGNGGGGSSSGGGMLALEQLLLLSTLMAAMNLLRRRRLSA